ncbi:NAD(P)H-hydrate epimerase (EC / ADP-dependent (S)-NAD(P)H-hydrate dehydratase (EC [Olavius sp. associated proteobacterium Delta 1]|nr:NAD(P)H-hydrate epimerase (EC / ADP-dependent (S)-NAD(P)H-hydrate dehydratase (EC [Olavius sp. associated proteobacterium Delta 1]
MILVTANEMQAMDRQTIEDFGIPGMVLMENAGRGATRFLLEQFPDIENKKVGVIAGRGNNGGDGFVIARYLKQKGIRIRLYLLAKTDRVLGDALANLKLLKPLGVPVVEIPDEASFSKIKSEMHGLDLWIDAILGTGLKSDVKGYYKTIIDCINSLNKPVFAVDMPSGLNSDTGQPCGTCISAAATATFAYAKTGHMVYPGADYIGNLKIVDIGIPPHIVAAVGPRHFLITAQLIRSHLIPRPATAHKGSTGHLLVVAGSTGKTGAASMTSMSALRTGAGLVTLGVAESLNPALEGRMLEAMTAPLPESGSGVIGESAFNAIRKELPGKRCLAIGPGLGQAAETKKLICKIIRQSEIPVVVDADGLNNLAGELKHVIKAKAPIILTPHPGEMARLLDTKVSMVQQNRIKCAREFSVQYNVHVVLKGAATIIAHPDGRVFINPTGNAGMASGGMGDVLTGVIAGLIVQGLAPEAACHAGVYLHGAAADSLVENMGPYGYLAGDVMKAIPREIKKIVQI